MKTSLNIRHNLIYVKMFNDGGLNFYNVFFLTEEHRLTTQNSTINKKLKLMNQRKKIARTKLSKKSYFRYGN